MKEQIKLLRDRLFGRKSEQTVEPNTPQLALFNEPESEPMSSIGDADEEVVAPTSRRGKRKPLSADLPRIEVIHELPEHELTCACGCRKHVVSEETSEQLDIVPMQIRVPLGEVRMFSPDEKKPALGGPKGWLIRSCASVSRVMHSGFSCFYKVQCVARARA